MKITNKNLVSITVMEFIIITGVVFILVISSISAVLNSQKKASNALLEADAKVIVMALNTYNALAKEPITENSAVTVARLKELALSTDNEDLTSLALNIEISQGDLDKILEVIAYQEAAWVIKTHPKES